MPRELRKCDVCKEIRVRNTNSSITCTKCKIKQGIYYNQKKDKETTNLALIYDWVNQGCQPPSDSAFPEGYLRRVAALVEYSRTKLNIKVCPVCKDDPFGEECMLCGMLHCPSNEPLHYHHDGCPACYVPPKKVEK